MISLRLCCMVYVFLSALMFNAANAGLKFPGAPSDTPEVGGLPSVRREFERFSLRMKDQLFL